MKPKALAKVKNEKSVLISLICLVNSIFYTGMISIQKATAADFEVLTEIGKNSFLESHGHSGPKHDIDAYVSKTYNIQNSKRELSDPENIYHILYSENEPAGYSKIIFNAPHPDIAEKSVTKLERIYLLEKYYSQKLGAALFQFNLDLSKQEQQAGMWLYTWKENPRAIRFYEKAGFTIIGSFDFRISETHVNPNHLMWLKY